MQDLVRGVRDLLDGGELWLGPGVGPAPRQSAVVATSGSAGEPKLVVLSRNALVAASEAAEQRLGFRATWHLALPGVYVAGLMVVVRGLLGRGVRAVDPGLGTLALAEGPNAISIVATQLYRALRQPRILSRLAAFDAVLVGGGALDHRLRRHALDAGIPVIETYGMSETCGGVVWDGLPLPGIDVRLDDTGRVRIAGPTLFTGYHERADLTGKALVGGALLTNDRGHWDGTRLVIDGRVDDVIVSGGINVDLAEVRAAASALDPETAVLGMPDAEWGSRVVLFATAGSVDSWRERLRPLLPAAGLPRQVVTVDRIPRTPGGKPDRRRLLELAGP